MPEYNDNDNELEVVITELNTLAFSDNFSQPALRPATNQTVEAEFRHLTHRWEQTGLLAKLDDEFKGETAVMLENQRLMNEHSVDSGDIAQFKRISIPLVRRIMGGSCLRHFVSVQPMLGPNSLVYYFKNNKIVSADCTATTKKMKAVWCYEAQQDLRARHNLDAEAELTAVLAQELTMEIDRMGILDITNNAALKKEINFNHLGGETINDKWAAVQEMVVDLALETQQLYHRPFPNWIITSPEMAKTICPPYKDEYNYLGHLGVHRWGSISTDEGDITVWCDPLYPTGKVLIGYKGEHKYDAGYIFAPYVMLGQTPVVLDPNTFVPRKGILSRYGKRLVDPTYYATLHVQGFISQDQWDDMEAVKNNISTR